MPEEKKTASDILLDVQSKIDNILNIIRNQDLNIKLLSNKLNMLLSNNEQHISQAIPQIQNNQEKFVSSDFKIDIDQNPNGFRRTSRPETFSSIPPKKEIQDNNPEVLVPKEALSNKNEVFRNSIPTQQRVVDKNGKSVFLADVEILNSNGERISKCRTNGTGKWMAALPTGEYKIILNKRESTSKQKIEVIQNIIIDGKTTPLELQTLVLK